MIRSLLIKEFFKQKLAKYILGLVTLLASSIFSLALPKLLGFITDGINSRTFTMPDVVKYLFIMLGLGIFIFILKFTFRTCIIGTSRDLECFLRTKLIKKYQELPPKFFNHKKTGDLMSYVINDLGAIRMAFGIGLIFLVDGIIINSFSIVIMAQTINLNLTLLALLPVVLSVVLVILLKNPIRKKFMRVQESFADLSDKIQENVSGIRVVKAYVQEEPEIKKLSLASKIRIGTQMDYVRLSALLGPFIQLSFGISFALILVFGSMNVVNGKMSLGDFIAFNTYLALLVSPLAQFSRTVEIWQRAMASMKRLEEILEKQTDITDDRADFSIKEIKGSISIRNLDFGYPSLFLHPNPNKSVFSNINIEVPDGKTLGIIGKTGSGKTTLVNLLLRLYLVPDGMIFIDGNDINHIPLKILRENIGLVPQDNFLFATTIRDNIKFFDDSFTEEDVEAAAKFAAVYNNIKEFPDGFDTVIGERGITLSGGQKQRVSIARAFIKKPEILILDDSLSAVDTKTEEEILVNIKKELEGKTGIIIAHRISTIKHADEIIFMDRGKIIERGTHDELIGKNGEYSRLNKIQALESQLGAEA